MDLECVRHKGIPPVYIADLRQTEEMRSGPELKWLRNVLLCESCTADLLTRVARDPNAVANVREL